MLLKGSIKTVLSFITNTSSEAVVLDVLESKESGVIEIVESDFDNLFHD